MQKALTVLLFSFLTLSFTHCKKSEVDPPDPNEATCKLTAIDRGNGNQHQYTYNAAGLVSQWTIRFKGSTATEPEQVYVYTFDYNGSNQITGATITVDGKVPDQLTDWGVGSGIQCRWTNGKLTEIKDLLGTQTILTTTISYDAQDRITRFYCIPANKNEPPFEKSFTYDANGNDTYLYTEDGEKLYFEEHTYDPATKSAESLLASRGLPFDIFNLYPWKSHVLKAFKTNEFDESGKAVSPKSFQITNVVKNSRNLAVSQTIEEGGTKRLNTFTLADCD
ncbi:hypothetical protein GCM10028803_29910 [Larkinella knui]|uniref:DUF4595 domain-containing protein n=1 Tax=Larkinella knui TaxID=2025310 RepID=A0A3P1CY48_9BACT|nr:hypothetical protein [Larkinella knui]RRB18020.1 hypothetical protein EHT87_07035 [Larkinella knui]